MIIDHIELSTSPILVFVDTIRIRNTFLVLVRSFTKSPICNIDLCIGYKLGPIFFWQVQINLFLFAENNVVVNFFLWNYSTRTPFLEILCRLLLFQKWR